ncbi:MAG: hypothetical protein ACODAJ_03700 [Planctomycetota bacterium]
MANEAVDTALEVIDALDALGVPYFICGSLAAAARGMVRSTADADLIADLRPEHAESLAEALGGRFYVDVESIRYAIERRRSFNVVHLETMFKVDVFVSRPAGFDGSRFERRRPEKMLEHPERHALVESAEDTILAKLRWFRLSDGNLARQWEDAVRLIEIQGEELDVAYLDHWADELGLADLLDRALAEGRG